MIFTENYALKAVRLLSEKHLKITAAESCTGGLISKLITDVSGASSVFDCGIVSYSNEIKQKLLGVSEDTLKKYGAVSEQTVREMAEGAIKAANADISIAVSGIAGPFAEDTDKPAGLIWIAVRYKNITTVKKLNNNYSENIRESNRLSAANTALQMVCTLLENNN